jgi:hypothetical protein
VEIHSQNGFAHSYGAARQVAQALNDEATCRAAPYGKTELLSALSEPLSEVVCTPQLPEWN